MNIDLVRKVSLTISLFLQWYNVSQIPEGENKTIVTLDFASNSLGISNEPELLKCFLNLPLLDVVVSNPFDFNWIYEQHNIGNDLATNGTQYLGR